MTQTIRDQILGSPHRCDHAAQLYTDHQSLCDAITIYTSAALDRQDAVIVIATRPHMLFSTLLRFSGRDVDSLTQSGQLQCIDAAETLPKIMNGRMPDRTAFLELAEPMIENALKEFGGLSAYGELVNILWQQRNCEAAHQLEQWWNELIDRYSFTLLCGYKVDVFDEREQAGIDSICMTHTHLIPVSDCARFERAIDAAMQEAIPSGDIEGMRRDLAARCRHFTQMPAAQTVLSALHDILPTLAHDIRLRAGAHYHRDDSAVAL